MTKRIVLAGGCTHARSDLDESLSNLSTARPGHSGSRGAVGVASVCFRSYNGR